VTDETVSGIREVLVQQARLPVEPGSIGLEDDLFEAGMSSHASVNVMLALEDKFDIEFPDSMLTRSSFASIAAIAHVVTRLQEEPAAG
jgi:acyl carrier protein